jgi:hypothetical protein
MVREPAHCQLALGLAKFAEAHEPVARAFCQQVSSSGIATVPSQARLRSE